jgi:hypothetical protein
MFVMTIPKKKPLALSSPSPSTKYESDYLNGYSILTWGLALDRLTRVMECSERLQARFDWFQKKRNTKPSYVIHQRDAFSSV